MARSNRRTSRARQAEIGVIIGPKLQETVSNKASENDLMLKVWGQNRNMDIVNDKVNTVLHDHGGLMPDGGKNLHPGVCGGGVTRHDRALPCDLFQCDCGDGWSRHDRALHMGGGKSDPTHPKSDQTSWGVISEVRLQRLERELLELKGKLHGQELRHQKHCASLWQQANELWGNGTKKDIEENNITPPCLRHQGLVLLRRTDPES